MNRYLLITLFVSTYCRVWSLLNSENLNCFLSVQEIYSAIRVVDCIQMWLKVIRTSVVGQNSCWTLKTWDEESISLACSHFSFLFERTRLILMDISHLPSEWSEARFPPMSWAAAVDRRRYKNVVGQEPWARALDHWCPVARGSHSMLFCMCYIKFLPALAAHLLIEARAAVLLACLPASLFGQ